MLSITYFIPITQLLIFYIVLTYVNVDSYGLCNIMCLNANRNRHWWCCVSHSHQELLASKKLPSFFLSLCMSQDVIRIQMVKFGEPLVICQICQGFSLPNIHAIWHLQHCLYIHICLVILIIATLSLEILCWNIHSPVLRIHIFPFTVKLFAYSGWPMLLTNIKFWMLYVYIGITSNCMFNLRWI